MTKIPAEFAQIEWSDVRDDRTSRIDYLVDEVLIFDRRATQSERDLRMRQKKFDNSHGACVGEWMNGDPQYTPEAIFIQLCRRGGFIDDLALLQALEEFAKIEGAIWADTMAKALRSRLIAEEIIPEEVDDTTDD